MLSADGEQYQRLYDLVGTDELDPTVMLPERVVHATPRASDAPPPHDTSSTFRYLDTDVFGGKGAPVRRATARLHVYQLVSADSVLQLRDVAVPRTGRVELRLPADTPLFEQLTDLHGRALMSAHGPAQVRGFNTGARGMTARCTGCHLGHSAAPK